MSKLLKLSTYLIIFTFVLFGLSQLESVQKFISSVNAATPVLDAVFLKTDGTAPFDANTWTPDPLHVGDGVLGTGTKAGEDSSSVNGVVRVGDQITYRVESSVNNADVCNHTVTITVDQNQYFTNLPVACLTTAASDYATKGCSALSPVSSISSDKRTVVCNLGFTAKSTLRVAAPVATVNPLFKDASGNTIGGNNRYVTADATVSADGATSITLPQNQTLTTASFKLDLVKALEGDTGWVVNSDPSTHSQEGRTLTYAMSLVVKKGSEMPNTNNFSFVDNYIYIAGVNHSQLVECGVNKGEVGGLPYGDNTVAGATTTNSLSQLATVNCVRNNPPFPSATAPMSVTITNAATTPTTIPTKNVNNSAITIGDTVIFSGYIKVWVPKDDVFCYGTGGNNSWGFCSGGTALSATNSYTALKDGTGQNVTSISGIVNYGGVAEDTATNPNNSVSNNMLASEPGGWCTSYTNNWHQGCGGSKNGLGESVSGISQYNTPVLGGTSNIPQILAGGSILEKDTGTGVMSTNYFCIPIDTRFIKFTGLKSEPEEIYPNPTYTAYDPNSFVHSHGVLKSSGSIHDCSNILPGQATCAEIFKDPVFEYSTAPYPAFSSRLQGDMYMASTGCGDTEGNWQTYDPSLPTPAGITKIRMRIQQEDSTLSNMQSGTTFLHPKFSINSGIPVGTKIPFFTKASNDATILANDLGDKYNSWYVCENGNINCGFRKLSVIFDNPGTINASPKAIYTDYVNSQLSYDPIAGTQSFGATYSFNSANNDIITIISAQASVAKDILNSAGTAVDNSNTVHVPGDIIKYQITSALAAPSGSGNTTATLTDTLPANMSYVPGSTICDNSGGGDCTSIGDPAISGQVLTWTLSGIDTQNYVLPVLKYSAQLTSNAGNGSYTNTVRIATPLDTCSTDSTCTRYSQYAASRTVTISIPAQFSIEKASNASPIEVNGVANYDLKYYATTATLNYAKIIDIFPYSGDTRGSVVNGQVQFYSLAVHHGETLEYTTDAVSTLSEDPCDYRNIPVNLAQPGYCPALPGVNGVVETAAGNQAVLSGDDQPNLVGSSSSPKTNWISVTAPYNSTNIPANATAIRITIANAPALTIPTGGYQMELGLLANGAHNLDQLQNSMTARINAIRLPIYSQAEIDVVGSTLGDKVWQDLNGDGVQDPAEPGIAGVQVCIVGGSSTNPPVDPLKLDPGTDGVFGTSDDALLCTTTDTNGMYSFTNLSFGDYQVTVTPPAGAVQTFDYDSVKDNVGNVSLALGVTQDKVDFGYQGSLVISGTVYEELVTIDNTKNGADTGISGVVVTLKDSLGNVVATTTTLADGSYSFGNLLPGDYTVVETQPTSKNFTSTENPTNEIPVTLTNANISDQNFGEVVYAPINGKVYLDGTNAPVAGVTITLTDSSGNVVATTQTLADGSYVFPNVVPGDYTITETQPVEYLTGLVNPTNTISVTQTLTQLPSQDFSEKVLSISGTVYEDKNISYTLDQCSANPFCGKTKFDDARIAGVIVTLTDSFGHTATTVTDANGNYTFTGLIVGNYTVTETQPTGYLSTQNATNQVPVSLTTADVANVNFGETLPNTISGYVYVDANNNGVKDPGEMPLAGEIVTLQGIALTNNGAIVGPLTATTNADGYYEFANVAGGFYYVIETQPANYQDGQETLGSLGVDFSVILANDNMFMIISSGEKAENYNFGEIPYPPVFGKVYVDSTNTPLSGVVVSLKDSNGNVIATTTTDSNGNYVFNNVKPGDYTIVQTQPSGYNNGKVNPSNLIKITQTTSVLGSQDFSEVKVLATTGNTNLLMQVLELFGK